MGKMIMSPAFQSAIDNGRVNNGLSPIFDQNLVAQQAMQQQNINPQSASSAAAIPQFNGNLGQMLRGLSASGLYNSGANPNTGAK